MNDAKSFDCITREETIGKEDYEPIGSTKFDNLPCVGEKATSSDLNAARSRYLENDASVDEPLHPQKEFCNDYDTKGNERDENLNYTPTSSPQESCGKEEDILNSKRNHQDDRAERKDKINVNDTNADDEINDDRQNCQKSLSIKDNKSVEGQSIVNSLTRMETDECRSRTSHASLSLGDNSGEIYSPLRKSTCQFESDDGSYSDHFETSSGDDLEAVRVSTVEKAISNDANNESSLDEIIHTSANMENYSDHYESSGDEIGNVRNLSLEHSELNSVETTERNTVPVANTQPFNVESFFCS